MQTTSAHAQPQTPNDPTAAKPNQTTQPNKDTAPEKPGNAAEPTTEQPTEKAGTDNQPVLITISATKTEALQKSSGSGTTVTPKEIKRSNAANTAEILRRVPSLNVRTEDGMGLRLNIGIRGMSPTRSRLVLVLEDGVPVTVSPYGEPELYFSTPIERVSGIEVIKGSESLMYGPQTLGGVVNFKTWVPLSRQSWTLDGEVGQRSYRKLMGRYSDSYGDIRYLLQIAHKEGDGFRNMGFATNDFMSKIIVPTSDKGELSVKLTAYDEQSSTTYLGMTQRQFTQDPRQPTVAPNDHFSIRRYEATLSHLQRFSEATTLRTTVFAYTTKLGFRQQGNDPVAQNEGDIVLLPNAAIRDRDYNVVGIEPTLQTRFHTSYVLHSLTAGARIMVDSARRKSAKTDFPASESNPPINKAESGTLQTDNLTSILGLSAYLQDRIAFRDDLLVIPGLRVEHSASSKNVYRDLVNVPSVASPTGTRLEPHEVAINGSSNVTGVMPGVGMIAGTPRFNVFGSVHSGYSPPRIALAITPRGEDAALDAERSVNWELGTHVKPWGWWRAELTGFLINFSNQLISNNVLSGSFGEFKNGGATQQYGAEFATTAQVGKGLKLPLEVDITGRYTYAHATFVGGLNDGRFVPYAPENTASLTLDVEHEVGLGAQGTWTFVDKQYADEFNTVKPDESGRTGLIPSYHVLDFSGRYNHKRTGLTASVSVKNALDQPYLSSRLPNGIFTSGFRQINVGLRWEH